MASNATTITDPDYGAYADWIELYNGSGSAVNLNGYSVTDDLLQPAKYTFTTDIIIPPYSYAIIWADDAGTGNHANFKLSASGEHIGLFDPAGNVIDTLAFGDQASDVSTGRVPDGSAGWFRLSPASPGSANLESQIFERLDPPSLSLPSGFSGPVSITISHPTSGAEIRYTRDGHTPTAASLLYTSPLQFDTTGVLRARAFKAGSLPSATVTATYFINEATELPVFSLVTDPEDFFSDTSGIYVSGTNGITGHCSTVPRNWNQEWERPVELEFFERDRQTAFKTPAGVQIHGGCTRLYDMKSLAFYFRDQYGAGRLPYRLFPDECLTEYNNFLLRSSGQDWWRTMFRDAMVQTLVKQGMRIDYQNYRPSVLFINGQYWGIHNIRDKYNEHYVHYHYGVNGDSVDLIEVGSTGKANNGDLVAYRALVDFYSTHDLAQQANYDSLLTMVDIDNYIDYTIAEIYAANADWPGSNMKMWRERKPGARWRWLIYDTDFCFGGNGNSLYSSNTLALATATNGPSWPNPPWSTLLLRNLLGNTGFRNEFIQRFAAHFNTTFERYHVIAIIDSLMRGIASEIPRHKLRWAKSLSIGSTWEANVQIMRDFAGSRRSAAVGHFVDYFGLSGTYWLTLSRNDTSAGKIFVHDLELKSSGTATPFFQNIPVRLRAMSMPGYRFVRWEGTVTSANPETTFVFSTNTHLTAVFEPAPLTVTSPVINEINYKSADLFDTDDWVELYNPSADPLDLGSWQFRDEGNSYLFPVGTTIAGRGYLVLCRDTTKFRALRLAEGPILGNTGIGLSASGERIQLVDPGGSVVDEVTYGTQGAWTSAPNGTGATLSLVNPQKDNALPAHWLPSRGYGTPGALNDVYTRVERDEGLMPEKIVLFNNYPNPFNPTTKIRYGLPARAHVSLVVYNTLGQAVASLAEGEREAGYYEVEFSAHDLSSGVYFCRLHARPSEGAQSVQTRKLLLLR
jgi:hypothetical protein